MLFPTLMHSFLIFAILLPFSSAGIEYLLPNLFLDCGSGLTPGYYDNVCPGGVKVEDIIRGAVTQAVASNNGLCAGVIRMHFHDCFVGGCDGSVLLNISDSERTAIPNQSLRGFEVIDAAKTAVEAQCPGKVSCADVLAFAARDCVKILGNFSYAVPAGRLDSRISNAEEALTNLPAPFFGITQLMNSFASKGLSVNDLVLLSAGHSIGISHCSSFTDRITDPINTTIINSDYAQGLKQKCSVNGAIVPSITVPQDHITPDKLDVQWYKNNDNNEVLFFSDWSLRDNTQTQALMDAYADHAAVWQLAFGCSMQKMGRIIDSNRGPLEIRKKCSAINMN